MRPSIACAPSIAATPHDEAVEPRPDTETSNTRALVAARRGAAVPARESVVLVGAGIVNLMTAHRLACAGFGVTLVDRIDDPRRAQAPGSASATHGGSDARMVTVIEGDMPDMDAPAGRAPLSARVSEGGWLLMDPSAMTARERAFLADKERSPAGLVASLRHEILALTRQSGALWHELMGAQPALFEDTGTSRGVLRLFGDAAAMERARHVHESAGDEVRALGPDEVRAREPALADAVARGVIAGGLAVPGFTVNIHRLVARVLGDLERRGARLVWRRTVRGIGRDADGRITWLDADDVPAADHYVLSPGALSHALLAGTRCDGAIHGLLGVWLSVPSLAPRLGTSLKLQPGARPGQVNVTLAADASRRPILIISTGYAYTGERAPAPDAPELEPLHAQLEEHARDLLPAAHAHAAQSGMLRQSRRACIRPWTAHGAGLFDVYETVRGGRLIITGGHSTGGFAQAMAVAEAVEAALVGTHHAMHVAFHPARGHHASTA